MGRIITNDLSGFGQIKTKRIFHPDGKIEEVSVQDVEAILDQNKSDQADRDFKNGYSKSGDMKHVARVPLIVWKKWWMDECARQRRQIPIYGKEMNEIARNHLNNPDNKFLRTGLGEIGKGNR